MTWRNNTALVPTAWPTNRTGGGCAIAQEPDAPCLALTIGAAVVTPEGEAATLCSLSPVSSLPAAAPAAANSLLCLPKEFPLATVIWSDPTCEHSDEAVSHEGNDLAWMSLSRNGEVHTVDGDLCHLILVCEDDLNTESPDPFHSDSD